MYLSQLTRQKPPWWSSDPHAQSLDREATTACTGVRILKRLTRMTPVQRQLLAEKKIRVIPALFALKRRVTAERKAGNPLWRMHEQIYRANVEKGWGPGYALTNEADELARAHCELARAKVDAWRVLAPAAVAARIVRVPTTEKERLEQRVNEMLRTSPPSPRPKRSFSQLFWRKVDDRLDKALGRTKLSPAWRKRIKQAAHSAIQKGAKAALGKALDEAGVKGEVKEAIEATVRGAAQRPGL